MVPKFGYFGKVYQKYLESFGMWCWRRKEKISWTDCVRNKEILRRAQREEYPTKIKTRKANWIGHILRRNCLLKHVIEGKIERRTEVMRRRGRRRKQLLYDFNEKRGY
jgi:hypothetical protein